MTETSPRSAFDVAPDDAHEAAPDAQPEADIAAGRTIAHSRAREWLAKLARGEKEPPSDA
jgi:hypothetical protein